MNILVETVVAFVLSFKLLLRFFKECHPFVIVRQTWMQAQKKSTKAKVEGAQKTKQDKEALQGKVRRLFGGNGSACGKLPAPQLFVLQGQSFLYWLALSSPALR